MKENKIFEEIEKNLLNEKKAKDDKDTDKKKSDEKVYVENSEIILESYSKEGKLNGITSLLNKKDKSLTKLVYKQGELNLMEVYHNDKIVSSMQFVDDKLHGEFKQFENGLVKSIQLFEEGLLNGDSKFYEIPGDDSRIEIKSFIKGKLES